MRNALLVLVVLCAVGCPKRSEVPDGTPPQESTTAERPNEQTGTPPIADQPAVVDAGALPPPPPVNAPPPQTQTQTDQDVKPRKGSSSGNTTRNGTVPAGGACTQDSECPQGMVCEGCSDNDRRCLGGCRTDADCTGGEKCQTVQCIRCPCPKLCGS